MKELLSLPATVVVELLKSKQVKPVELIDLLEDRCNEVDGAINAMPIRCFERARDRATSIESRSSSARNEASWLAGLPVGIKDLSRVAGVKTTMGGSPIFKDFVPEDTSYDVENVEQNGGLVVGKVTSPEFGFNATTYSQLWGFTRNPWDTSKSTAGSSGGSAAAVAAGLVWAATGSDLGASIRTPASFCGIVGLRPSPGLVPRGPVPYSFTQLPVQGPMARNVCDTALMMNAMVGLKTGDPLSFAPPETDYLAAAQTPKLPKRVAVSTTLGLTHCDSEIADLTLQSAQKLEALGCVVEEVHPDLTGAIEAFHTIRGTGHIAGMGPLLDQHPELISEEVRWSVETARKQTADQIAQAERTRARMQANINVFLQEYDLLICPANVVPPFPVEWTTVHEHQGHSFERYIDWIAITFAITLTACPTLSVPCGFLKSGMPLGLQLVGRPRSEFELFSYGRAFEEAMDLGSIAPIDPRDFCNVT